MLLCLASCNIITPPDGGNDPTHVHTFTDWTIIKQANCGEEGIITRECSTCQIKEEQKITPTGVHRQTEDAAVAATCTSVGLSSGVHCADCGMVILPQTEIPMIPHTYSSENDATCNKCGFARDVICAHNDVITLSAKQATCTEKGLTEGTKCANCGDILVPQTEILAIGHTEVVEEAVSPTCTESGYTVGKTCSVCKDVLVFKAEVPATGHKATEWIIETDPTESSEGLKYKICTVCTERFDDTVIPFVSANGIAYEPNTIGNTCTVTGIGTFDGEELIIPDYISGYRVTAIAGKAFQNCAKLTKLVLPETVKTIGYSAFAGCTALTEFTIPASVTYIESNIFSGNTNMTTVYYNSTYSSYSNLGGNITKVVFNGSYVPKRACYGCSNIKEVEFGSNVTEIGSEAFENCSGLTKIVIPEGVVSIGERAFYYSNISEISLPSSLISIGKYAFYSSNIESITIPYGVTSIGDYAFAYCGKLKTVNLPDTVTSIGSYAFSNCHSLKSITIPKGLTEISSSMFSHSGLTSIVIPENIITIGSDAFYDCPLVNVIIEEGVTTIGGYAFDSCNQLTGIVIPESVKTINSYAFRGCISLTDVYYTGTQTEWSGIDIKGSNEYLINAEKYYNYVPKS